MGRIDMMFSRLIQNRTLMIAVLLSLLLHGGIMAMRFSTSAANKVAPTAPTLEVILVNSKHDESPLKPQALAQANLDGGGNEKSGHAKSPLPDLKKVEDGDSLETSRAQVAALEQERKRLLLAINERALLAARMQSEQVKPDQNSDVAKPLPPSTRLARMEAEIAKTVDDRNQAPRKTRISPSTKGVGYALYYKQLQEKVEKIGTLDFPHVADKKLYGTLVMTIPVYQDGSIYLNDGGLRIDRSSGNPQLDAAAIMIVMKSAPFGAFPKNMRSTGRNDVWEIVTTFDFSKNNELGTRVFSTDK